MMDEGEDEEAKKSITNTFCGANFQETNHSNRKLRLSELNRPGALIAASIIAARSIASQKTDRNNHRNTIDNPVMAIEGIESNNAKRISSTGNMIRAVNRLAMRGELINPASLMRSAEPSSNGNDRDCVASSPPSQIYLPPINLAAKPGSLLAAAKYAAERHPPKMINVRPSGHVVENHPTLIYTWSTRESADPAYLQQQQLQLQAYSLQIPRTNAISVIPPNATIVTTSQAATTTTMGIRNGECKHSIDDVDDDQSIADQMYPSKCKKIS